MIERIIPVEKTLTLSIPEIERVISESSRPVSDL